MSSTKIVNGDYTIQSLNGNVNIIGNLTVTGAHNTVEQTKISDNVITLNSGQTGGAVSTMYTPAAYASSGVEVDRGNTYGLRPALVYVENGLGGAGVGQWQYSNDGTIFQALGTGSGGGGTSSANVASVTNSNPVLITTTAPHNFVTGEYVTITAVNGTTQLNGNSYYANVQTASTFTLYSDPGLTTPVNGSGYGSYAGGGNIAGSTGLNAVHSDRHPSLGGNLNIAGYTIYDSANAVVLSMQPVGNGGTGVYITNTVNINQELVTNKKALTYSIIFG